MSYTFGGATTNDITPAAMPISIGSSASYNLWMGWFYPTTLTAGRVYFGNGNTIGIKVDTTTSELRYNSDFATTDSDWSTSGAGITTDKWWFIAAMFVQNGTGPADDLAIWVGDIEQPPVEVSATRNTSGAGGVQANTTFSIGNQGSTGSLSFEGNIANVLVIQHAADASAANIFLADSATSLSTNVRAYTLDRWVRPVWQNNFPNGRFVRSAIATNVQIMMLHGGNLPGQSLSMGGNAASLVVPLSLTVSGPTYSEIRVPNPLVQPPHEQRYVRR